MANGNSAATSLPAVQPAPAFSSAPLPQPNVPITGASPGMLQLQAALAQKMLEQGIDYSPIRSPWQGAARVADAIFGGMAMRDLNRQYLEGQAQAGAALGAGMGALGGGGAGTGTGGATATGGGGAGGGGAGRVSMPEMVQMAQNAGFQGDDAAHMAALAMAESGGNPNAVGGAGEIGLTQINPHAWGADMANSARNPQGAFNAAYQVFKRQGWGAWSTDPSSRNFTPGNNGLRFFPTARQFVSAPAQGGTAVAANQPSGAAQPMGMTELSPGGGFKLPGSGEEAPDDAGGAAPSPAGAGGLPPQPVPATQPAPPGATQTIPVNGIEVWAGPDGKPITAAGAALPPAAVAPQPAARPPVPGAAQPAPAAPIVAPQAGGLRPPNTMDLAPGVLSSGPLGAFNNMPFSNQRDPVGFFAPRPGAPSNASTAAPGAPAATTLPPSVVVSPPLPPPRPPGLGVSPAGAPPAAAAGATAIPPGATALARPQPVPAPAGAVPQGAALYQGRTQLGMPGQPGQLAPTPGGAALSPQQSSGLLDAIGQAFGGLGNAVGGLFRGGAPAPGQSGAAGGTIPAGATALAPGAQGGQGGAQPAGGMSAAVGYAMQVINSPYATDAQKQIAIGILNRSMSVGQIVDIGKDPDTGADRKAIYNPTTGQITPLDPRTGLPVAAGGAAPAGGGGAAPAADGGTGATKGWAGPEELDDGQKADWNKIMAQPTGDVGELLIGPRPPGMTNPDYQGAVKKAIADERGKLEDQLKNGPGFSSYSNSVAAWNSMLASAANAKPSSGVDIVRAFNKIMAPNSPRGLSSDDLKEAFESAGIPAEVFYRGKAAIFGNSPMSAEMRKALIEVAQNRINTYRGQYGDEAVSIGEKAHMLGISPQLILPGRMRMNPYDESKVVEPQASRSGGQSDPRPPAAIQEGVPQNATPQSDGSFTWPDPDHPGKIKRWRP